MGLREWYHEFSKQIATISVLNEDICTKVGVEMEHGCVKASCNQKRKRKLTYVTSSNERRKQKCVNLRDCGGRHILFGKTK